MTNLSEDPMHDPPDRIQNDPAEFPSPDPPQAAPAEPAATFNGLEAQVVPAEPYPVSSQPFADEPPLYQYAPQLQPRPAVRIPHLGHLALLVPLLGLGFVAAVLLSIAAVHFHTFGVSSTQQAAANIHYILGTEAVIYVFSFGAALLVFPLFWQESLFAGLQWNESAVQHLFWRLLTAALACFGLAIFSGPFMSSPTNSPIEKVFRSPGAAWLLFAFGVTLAPFFEEMFFRGFLLPALCTAYDWIVEKLTGAPQLPLGPNGHPRWSLAAMIVGSIATSLPFALMHGEQTSFAIGPLTLLVGVSLVLCAVRLITRSLAASTLVHASYNFMLFTVMAFGTSGFRHFDKM